MLKLITVCTVLAWVAASEVMAGGEHVRELHGEGLSMILAEKLKHPHSMDPGINLIVRHYHI